MVDIIGATLRPINLYLAEQDLATGDADGATIGLEDNEVKRVYPTGRSSVLYPGVHFSLPAGYGAGTAAAINGAMAAASANGGGVVMVPPENIINDAVWDNKYPRVLVEAMGGGRNLHGVTAPFGCKVIPSFAGTVLKHRTPYAAETGGIAGPRNDGGGFKNICVIGNSLATKGLEVDSILGGIYHMHIEGIVGSGVAAEFKCGVASTDLSESTNIQYASIHLSIRQIDVGSRDVGGVKFNGSSNSNVCFNNDIVLNIQHYNGHAFECVSADNNDIELRAFSAGGTGNSVMMRGPTASIPVGGDFNRFLRLSANAPIVAEGTDTGGVTAGIANQICIDNANGTEVTTLTKGTGSRWVVSNLTGRRQGEYHVGLGVGDSTTRALEALNNLGTGTIRVYNGSDGHIALYTTAGEWKLYVNSSGDVRFARVSGTGSLDLNSVVKILGGLVSVGANDSGGAGFKLLRIPN